MKNPLTKLVRGFFHFGSEYGRIAVNSKEKLVALVTSGATRGRKQEK
jgi:hypothetical protein